MNVLEEATTVIPWVVGLLALAVLTFGAVGLWAVFKGWTRKDD